MATKTTKTKRTKKSTSASKGKAQIRKISILGNFSRFSVKTFFLPAIVILAVILLGVFKNQFIAANVNGDQISRLELIRELERSNGQIVLQNLITQKLIEQEGEKRGISITDEEIDAEIASIEKSIVEQGQNLDDLLAIQNFTREQLREQISSQLLLQKMVGEENTQVTDEELNEYIEQNQSSFPDDADMEKLKVSLREQLKQQKLNTEVQNLLSQLQQEADIQILLN